MSSLSSGLPRVPGWAGPSSQPTTEAARRVVDNFRAVPLESGGAQVEMHAGGCDIEIEITRSGRVRSVLWEADQ